MIQISLFKNRSLFIILLASSTANPLLALPIKNNTIVKRSVRTSNISQKVQETLVNKGLEIEAALRKTNKLFNTTVNVENKLTLIHNSAHLSVSKEKINNTLSDYALHEKKLDLESYDGVLRFIQNTSMKKLNKQALSEIKKIALSSL